MYYFRIVYQRYIILCDICQNIIRTYITEEIYRKHKAKKRYMCVYCHMSKKSRVGRLGLIFFFLLLLLLSTKPESDSGI